MHVHPVDHAVAVIARGQSGVFSRRQVLEAGGNTALIARRVRSGAWLRVASAVLALPGSEPSFRRALWVAVLDLGGHAVASHESAAAVHGLRGFPPNRLAVVVPHATHHRNPVAYVHQTRVPSPPVFVDGLPVTPIARTLVDVASRYGPARVGGALDDALLRRACSLYEVRRTYLDLARPGRRGIDVMARVLADRGDGYVPTRSRLEQALDAVLATLPGARPLREVPLAGWGDRPSFVDRLFLPERVIVEGDGRLWHARLDALERDRQRDRAAAALGYRTVRYGWHELVHEPSAVRAELLRILGR